MTAVTFDPTGLRQALATFPTGVTTLCALVGERPVGMSASSFTSVSLDPPLVSVAIHHKSRTWPLLRTAPKLGVGVLAEGQGPACRALASDTTDRFAGLRWSKRADGTVFLDGACLMMVCSIEAAIPAGDHDLIVLRAHSADFFAHREPLVFHAGRFRSLVD
ncbi:MULTISPECIES: flavin reductase family protein [unclassified Streptomyces]|uniref:flavin reductase family protein n=1 Tax=unclassified Streptomyces TaxID=2593676 RepID=UPI00044847ED|nr:MULTISPECIES: flavin reductase family protein [unclassified Streptomyces]EXU63684.1 flavin reductase [Streptomyces sp. PRh5]TMU98292.1 flavin reductase family protein [Streptomyces sp. DASNCL29]